MQLFQLLYKFHSIYCASLYPLKYKKMKLCTTFLAKFHLLISIPLPVHSPELPHLPRPMYRNKPKSSGNGEAFPVHGTLYCKVTLIYGTK